MPSGARGEGSHVRAALFVVAGIGCVRDGPAGEEIGEERCADTDADGFRASACGGDDCDDADATVHPGALDGVVWRSEEVDLATVDDGEVSIAPDVGDARIAYCVNDEGGGDLRYASNADGDWMVDTVWSGFRCEGPSIAVDRSSLPAVTYTMGYPSGESSFLYSSKTDSWVTTIGLDWAGALGGTSLVLVYDGAAEWPQMRATYHAESGALHYVEAGTMQSNVTIEERTAAASSLFIDAGGIARIAYVTAPADGAEGDLVVATRSAEGWDMETLGAVAADGIGFAEPSLALDPDGAVHVAYRNGADVGHATDGSGEWILSTIETEASPDRARVSPCLAIDASGLLHVAYLSRRAGASEVRYAVGGGAGWSVETVDSADWDVSLSLSEDAIPRVAYFSSGTLRLATLGAGGADDIDQDCDGAAE